jgi:hypothetical protein
MKNSPVAISIEEYVMGAHGMQSSKRKTVIPVSRIIKVIDQRQIDPSGFRPRILNPSYIHLRTPEDYMHSTEPVEVILAKMNGDTVVTPSYDCQHADAVLCDVFAPFEGNEQDFRKDGTTARLCKTCQDSVNLNPEDPRQVRQSR